MKKITVEDVLLQTVVTLVNLAGRRLTVEGEKDMRPRRRKAIDAARALLPLCPEEAVGPIKDALVPGADALREGEPGTVGRPTAGAAAAAAAAAAALEDLDSARLVIGSSEAPASTDSWTT